MTLIAWGYYVWLTQEERKTYHRTRVLIIFQYDAYERKSFATNKNNPL